MELSAAGDGASPCTGDMKDGSVSTQTDACGTDKARTDGTEGCEYDRGSASTVGNDIQTADGETGRSSLKRGLYQAIRHYKGPHKLKGKELNEAYAFVDKARRGLRRWLPVQTVIDVCGGSHGGGCHFIFVEWGHTCL